VNVELRVAPGELITFRSGIVIYESAALGTFDRIRIPAGAVGIVTSFKQVKRRKARDDAFIAHSWVIAEFEFMWNRRVWSLKLVQKNGLWVTCDPECPARDSQTKNFAFLCIGARP